MSLKIGHTCLIGYIFVMPLPFMGTLKLQINGPLYSNTVIGTLAVAGWLLHLFGTARAWAAQSPLGCTKCNSPPINGQCTNFILFDVAL